MRGIWTPQPDRVFIQRMYMINPEQILITEEEASSAVYGHSRREAVSPIAMAKRRAVANAQ